ncbi:MAG: choice-of-anchor B family protein [Bacteroidota bacterium]
MLRSLYLLGIVCLTLPCFAQQNAALVGRIDYDFKLNDVWGYTAPDGTEYALVGSREGTSIVDLSDPTEPTELFFVPGDNTVWRDLKTWEDKAYVTADGSSTSDGLVIIDLSDLPNSAPFVNYTPFLESFQDTLYNCHNLYIDEFGIIYLSGCNVNGGGVIAFDATTNPFAPDYLGPMETFYSHDAYVRENILYSSNINDGFFSVVNVVDKEEPIILAQQETPFTFTHNAWLSDDGNTLYTTDERRNASVAAYDLSELDDIQLLDEYRPAATLNRGVIPHNVHVLNEYIVVSYYTDGCIVLDGNRPHNLIQVAQYDTWPGSDGGFKGNWGAYPYLPSGRVLATDIDSGLFVLNIDYKRGCYFEGFVQHAETGAPLEQASISVVDGPEAFVDKTNLSGAFATGAAAPGNYTIRCSKPGFFPEVVEVTLANGELVEQTFSLRPKPTHQLAVLVLDGETGLPLEEAEIALQSGDVRYTGVTEAGGLFVLEDVFEDNYQVFAGQWGYQTQDTTLDVSGPTEWIVHLPPGFETFSELNLGWTVYGDAGSGTWERGVPIPTFTGSGRISNPGEDGPDVGNHAWVTKNEIGDSSVGEVDRGTTNLVTPLTDLSTFKNPVLSFDYWFYNAWSNIAPNDSLFVLITNGQDTLTIDTINQSVETWTPRAPITLQNYFELAEPVQFIFSIGDELATSHLLEAGIDHFTIREGTASDAFSLNEEKIVAQAFPVPTQDVVRIQYWTSEALPTQLDIYTALGQLVETIDRSFSGGSVDVDLQNYAAGVYWVRFRNAAGHLGSVRIVRY